MKQVILTTVLAAAFFFTNAQNTTCLVVPDSLKGSYDGDCSGGKANGIGKAKGADSYEGSFKNGYPEGQGKYIWKNGNYFTGTWKKGIKEGKGELHVIVNNKDSVVTGFWKKDVYKGEYENPYIIHNVTTEIGRVQVSKLDKTGNSITLTVESLVGGGSIYNSPTQATVSMTNFQVTRGQFMSKSQNTLTNKDVTIFRGVIYPFRASFNFGNSIFEIEIFEQGNWDISVPISK